MKRAFVQNEYDAFCEKLQNSLRHSLYHPEEDDDGDKQVWTITLDEGSFRSNYYSTRTLADIFITASSTQSSGNISLDIRMIPAPVYLKMVLACLPEKFYVQIDDVELFKEALESLGCVTSLDYIQVDTDQQLFRFAIETLVGSLPEFESTDDIPKHVEATIGHAFNRNNHVNKQVNPAAVFAMGPVLPPYIEAAIDGICTLSKEEADAIMPFILCVPAFLGLFEYYGPMEFGDVTDECRDAVGMLGYIVLKCLGRAYIEDDEHPEWATCDLDGYPLLITKVWMNACLGRYSGTEASEKRYDVEIDMTPRGDNMRSESMIECWLMAHIDKCIVDLVKESVTDEWMKQFPPNSNFDCIMSTPSVIEAYLGDILDVACYLSENKVKVDPFEVACRLANGHTALGFADTFCEAYENLNRTDPLFLRLFEVMPAYCFPPTEHVPRAIKDALFMRTLPEGIEDSYDKPGRKLFNHMQVKMISGHILRQAVELRPTILTAAPDVTSLPFVVQGESFVIPYHSVSSSPMVLFINQVATLHLKAFALATEPHFGAHEMVELPSHVFLYNYQGVRQHDYMYFFEAWGNRARMGAPTVFTAIVNMSSRNMTFKKQLAGRAINPTTGARQPARWQSDEPDISIGPGCMHMYRRRICQKDHNARPFTHQTRLSQLEDEFDEDEVPYEEDQAHVLTEGILYLQISIAVYDRAFYGRDMHTALCALHDQRNMGFIGGLQQSSIYQGKQAGTTDDDDFVDLTRKTKRYPYPLLYNQLTNAHRPNTRMSFICNYMMQRPEILERFYQDVLFIYNGSIPKEEDRIKLLIPKNGRAYDAQRHALNLDIQTMSFSDLLGGGHLMEAFRRTDNNSTFTTKEELAACNVSQDEYTRIYPCVMPPLRNLHGLPGMFSMRDHHATSNGIGLESRFQALRIMWV
jgi:hypothetical protein